VTGKGMAYAALGQYHAAEVASEHQAFGEQISRLQEAQRIMDQAISYVPSSYAEQNSQIKKALEKANKDNSFIYHERIPDFKMLPLLAKAALAKPMAVNFPLSPRFKDLFESLVPIAIQVIKNMFYDFMGTVHH